MFHLEDEHTKYRAIGGEYKFSFYSAEAAYEYAIKSATEQGFPLEHCHVIRESKQIMKKVN